jgi:hypothetical protein
MAVIGYRDVFHMSKSDERIIADAVRRAKPA